MGLLSVALVVLLMVGGNVAPSAAAVVPGAPSPATSAHLAAVTPVSPTVLGAGFVGADVRPYYPLNASTGGFLNDSAVHLIRWPGGAIADRYNLTANRIYADSGSVFTPPGNERQFASWCLSAHCHAIVQVPAEIDSPSTAAYDVAYTENTLHFHPDFWEIGNEPAAWTHFGLPWSTWNQTQGRNATPGTYAKTVQSYAAAMKAVDPRLRLIGLPGVGTGAYGETTWITATVRLNGPNLSAVAIHVYPAGVGPGGGGTLSGYYGTLLGTASLPHRVPLDRAAIRLACASCPSVQLFVTELGSGIQGGGYQTEMTGFPAVPYLTSELVQAAALNLTSVSLFAAQSSYGGSLLAPDGAPTVVAPLYTTILPRLQPDIVASVSTPGATGLFGVVSRSADRTTYSVLAANVNVTTRIGLDLSTVGLPKGDQWTVFSWNATTPAPVTRTLPGPANLTLDASSVLLLVLAPATPGAPATGPGISPMFGLGFSLSPHLLVALLALVAPTGVTFPCWATLVHHGRDFSEPPLSRRGRLTAWLRERL